jgi:hypothetical protein
LRFHVALPGSVIRRQMDHVLAGATRRLSRPACQQVLQEFRDGSGQLLQAVLDGRHQTVAEHLSSLRFVDGENEACCRSNSAVFAFTQRGSRVVFICGPRFQALFARDSATTEILIIHEVLHTLGLGENPPTSAEITSRVMKRCSG